MALNWTKSGNVSPKNIACEKIHFEQKSLCLYIMTVKETDY